MFESVQHDDSAARASAASAFPLAAILLTLLYLTVVPLLARVPAAVFWSIVAILFVGVLAGAVAITRVWRATRPRGAALAWLIAAIVIELVCARLFLSFTLGH